METHADNQIIAPKPAEPQSPIRPGLTDESEIIDLLAQQILQLQEALAHSESRNRELAKNLASKNELIKQMAIESKNEADALRAEAKALRASIDAIYGSTSWKVSAPVRALKKVVS